MQQKGPLTVGDFNVLTKPVAVHCHYTGSPALSAFKRREHRRADPNDDITLRQQG